MNDWTYTIMAEYTASMDGLTIPEIVDGLLPDDMDPLERMVIIEEVAEMRAMLRLGTSRPG